AVLIVCAMHQSTTRAENSTGFAKTLAQSVMRIARLDIIVASVAASIVAAAITAIPIGPSISPSPVSADHKTTKLCMVRLGAERRAFLIWIKSGKPISQARLQGGAQRSFARKNEKFR